jgi:hypothetical protein
LWTPRHVFDISGSSSLQLTRQGGDAANNFHFKEWGIGYTQNSIDKLRGGDQMKKVLSMLLVLALALSVSDAPLPK